MRHGQARIRLSTTATLCVSGARPSGRFSVTSPKSGGRCSDSPALLVVKRRKRRAPCERFTKCRCSVTRPDSILLRSRARQAVLAVRPTEHRKLRKEFTGSNPRENRYVFFRSKIGQLFELRIRSEKRTLSRMQTRRQLPNRTAGVERRGRETRCFSEFPPPGSGSPNRTRPTCIMLYLNVLTGPPRASYGTVMTRDRTMTGGRHNLPAARLRSSIDEPHLHNDRGRQSEFSAG